MKATRSIVLAALVSLSLGACVMDTDDLATAEGAIEVETIYIDAGTVAKLPRGENLHLELDAPVRYLIDYKQPFDYSRVVLHREQAELSLEEYFAAITGLGFEQDASKTILIAGDAAHFGTLNQDQISVLERDRVLLTRKETYWCWILVYSCTIEEVK